MSELSAALNNEEQAQLAACEATIQSGLRTFIEVGSALATIRDGRLYRDEKGTTFEQYCRARWAMSGTHAHRLIDSARISEAIKNSPIGELPQSESQARPLTTLETAEQQVKAWGIANERTGGKPTAKDVQAAVEEVKAEAIEADEVIPPPSPKPVSSCPEDGLEIVEVAISQMRRIQKRDRQRKQAWQRMRDWLSQNE